MAIDAYVGKPGHGKSYGVVEHVIIPSLKQGRAVVTNIPLQVDKLMKDFGGVIMQLPADWDKNPDFADEIPHGCVLVLDEVWRRWPSGLAVNKAVEADKVLFMEHRHRVDDIGNSMRIILVTQDLAQIASWVRLLIEQTFRVVKRVNVGMPNRYRVDIYDGPVTGDRPPKNKFLRSIGGGKYRKEIYQYYSSATQSKTGTVGDESKADGRGNALKSTSLVLGAIFFVAMLITAVKSGMSFFSPLVTEPAATPHANHQPAAQPPIVPVVKRDPVSPTARVEVIPTGPAVSLYWRVAGYIDKAPASKSEPTWPSRTGYNTTETPVQPSKMPGQVVLMSVNNKVRYMPISACDWYEDKIHLYCTVDGELVTPWTGQGAVTAGLPGSRGEVRAGTPTRERSESVGVTTAADPERKSTRFIGIPETRQPRTL